MSTFHSIPTCIIAWIMIMTVGFRSVLGMTLDVEVADDFSYSVLVDGGSWLHSSPLRAYFNHLEYSSPTKIGTVTSTSGTDAIGSFSAKTQNWRAGVVDFSTSVKVYSVLGVVVFETTVPNGATGTNASIPVVPGGWPGSMGNVKPIVAFPAFATDAKAVMSKTGLASLDQLRWEDNFCYYSHGPALTRHGNTSTSMLGQGIFGGPVVLHDRKNLTADATQSLTTLVLAPLDNVKHHGSYRNDTIDSPWELGVYSQVTSLPKLFSHRTVMVAGAGLTSTVQRYGALAMKLAGTNRTAALAKDLVVNDLGYWTDSGAYYYADIPFGHNLTKMAETAGPNMTMEDVSVGVKKALDQQNVPIKYWQWDDWWYPGHAVYVWCVAEWDMVESSFPSGLAGMHTKLQVPFLYYMPYWCMNNHTTNTPSDQSWKYLTTENCGWDCEYTFVQSNQSKDFHVELFNTYKGQRGLSNYEQDFMVTNFLKTNLYRTNLTQYPEWAQGLNQAAKETEVPLQFCMAMPSDIMLSVEFDWVTNARASDDYVSGDNLFNVPHAALLMWSLGIRPSKDNFWTSNISDNPYQKGNQPANPGSNVELNTIVAVLSTGPVGISDKWGHTNSTLIMATCDANGRLLQPAKPLTPSERMFTQIGQSGDCATCRGSLPQTGSDGQLWSTYSTVDHVIVWSTLALRIGCAGDENCNSDIALPLSNVDLYPTPVAGWDSVTLVHRYWHSRCQDGADAVGTGCVLSGVPDLRSTNRSNGAEDYPFDLITSQDGVGAWVLLGELNKYTTLSSQRFRSVTTSAVSLVVLLSGAVGETVAITALKKAAEKDRLTTTTNGLSFTVVVKSTIIGESGFAEIEFE
eukprot:m.218963 g.218963  ORF g.218963 m.218963 type:complete len:854 (+) comp33283_c0_seq1:365-2926(+)